MKTFTDSQNRPWRLSVTVGSIRAVRAAAGIDLMDVIFGETANKLASDPCLVGDILYELCKTQAEQHQLSSEGFAEVLDARTFESAYHALMDEIIDFFPNPDARKALKLAQETVILSIRNQLDAGMKQLMALRSASLNPPPETEQSPTAGGESGTAPESSELNPLPTPCAN